KIEVIVVRVLSLAPHVKGFINDHHTEPVAGIQECGRRRVVSEPQRVVPAGFQQFDAPLFGSIVSTRSERAVVVMQASAFELEWLAVQKKAPPRVERDSADTELCLQPVGQLSLQINFADSLVE